MSGAQAPGFGGNGAYNGAYNVDPNVANNVVANAAMPSAELPLAPIEPIHLIKYPLTNKPDANLLAPGFNDVLEQVDTPLADSLREEFWSRHAAICNLYDSWKAHHDHFSAIFQQADHERSSGNAQVEEARQTLQERQKEWANGNADFEHWKIMNPAVEIIINSIKEEMTLYPAAMKFQNANNGATPDQGEQLSRAGSAEYLDLWNVRVRAQRDANTIILTHQQPANEQVVEALHRQEQPIQPDFQGDNYHAELNADADGNMQGIDFLADYLYGDNPAEVNGNGNIQPNNAGGAQQIEM
ncbi:hypothetical protein QBC44DRAFT_316398 [Cladorrhinum sp. PSN332]|nr:hypothetical protein QBC44DRAFT_316398 [Cladorrhinum sp. PSN332]